MNSEGDVNLAYKPLILVFTTTYFPNIGGAEVAIREIAKRLPHYDWALFCARLDRSFPKHEVIDNITVRRLGWGFTYLDKILLPFASFFAAWRLLRERHLLDHEAATKSGFGAVRRSSEKIVEIFSGEPRAKRGGERATEA
jgi:hypothetical protein